MQEYLNELKILMLARQALRQKLAKQWGFCWFQGFDGAPLKTLSLFFYLSEGISFYIIGKPIWMALFWAVTLNFWVLPSWPKMALNQISFQMIWKNPSDKYKKRYDVISGAPSKSWNQQNPHSSAIFYLRAGLLKYACIQKIRPIWPRLASFGPIWPFWPRLTP